MLVKMLKTSYGPDVASNFQEGQKRNVSVEEAANLVKCGLAEALESFPPVKSTLKPEKAVTGPKEAAVAPSAATGSWGKGE